MTKISKKTALLNASLFEQNYRIRKAALDAAEAKVAAEAAAEEAARQVLKDYAQQNEAALFAEGVSTVKFSGDVTLQRRNGPSSYNLSLISKAEREYLVGLYPAAFTSVRAAQIDASDAKAQNLLRKCLTVADPTFVVSLASNSKAKRVS